MNPIRKLCPLLGSTLCWGLVAVQAGTWTPGLAPSTPSPLLRHSLVVGGLNNLDAVPPEYDLDLIAQQIDTVDETDVPRWKAAVDRLHAQGKLFFAGLLPATPAGRTMERLMEDPGLREAACLDFNLRPITPGWQAGRNHKGFPLTLFCSNHPRYRAFIRHLMFMYFETGPDGVFVDDSGGTPVSYKSGGCFCPYCMTRFRGYLRDKYTPAQWLALKLGDLDAFDYREVVRQHAADAAELTAARKRQEIPLDADFADFLRISDAELFQSLHSMADRQSGRHVLMSWDNFNFGSSRLAYYPTIDVLAPELTFRNFTSGHRTGDADYPPGIVLLNRLSDALGKWYSPIPAPPTWTVVKAGNLTGMVRLWIAATYANGGLPRYPRRGWCKMGKGGEIEWYDAPKAEFEPLYDFVRTHRDLLDGYENIAQVGVLSSEQSADISGPAGVPIRHVAESLVDLNMPFGVLLAGDRFLPQRLSPDDVRRFELILVPAATKLDAAQQQVVNGWLRSGAAFAVSPADEVSAQLAGRVSPLVALESKHDVRLFPRAIPGNQAAPIVCHLVNWAYDGATNQTPAQKDIRVRLRSALTGGAQVTKIIYHSVGRPAQSLPFTIRDGAVQVTVPDLELWGVLEVQHE